MRRFAAGIDIKALTALVPITALAFAFLDKQFSDHGSDLQATVFACEDKSIKFFASNNGNRAAVLHSASYRIFSPAGSHAQSRLVFVEDSVKKRQFGGGTSDVIELRPPPIGNLPGQVVPDNLRHKECRIDLQIHTVAFDHKPKDIELSCACPR